MSSVSPAVGRAPAPAPPNPNVATAIVFATVPATAGGVAAAQHWDGETVLERLIGQLASLGVLTIHVVTRPEHEEAVAGLLEGRGAALHASLDAAGDLRLVADIAREGSGGVVVCPADIVTQREALAGLLAAPRVGTGVLSTGGRVARPFGFRIRNRRGRVVSAQSLFHGVHGANSTFLGVLKVASGDRERLAEVADRLAQLRAEPPEGWRVQAELVRPGSWRLALARAARRRQQREAAGLAPEEEPEDDAAAEARAQEAEAAAELDPEGAVEEDEDTHDALRPDEVELAPEDAAELDRRLRAAREDVAALLLVGLVRDGAHVGNSHLRSLFWARPLSPEDLDRGRERIGRHDEDRALLDSAIKSSDGFFTTFFVSPYSKYIARWCARRGITPNQVTTLSMAIGLLAAAAFATGERWGLVSGAALLQVAFAFDCVDGQLARYTRTFSKLGAWLDSVFDRSKEYAAFAGLAIGAARTGGDVWVLACAAMGLQTARHYVDFSYPAAQHQAIAAEPQPPLELGWDGTGKELPRWARPEPLPAAPAEPQPPRPRPAPAARPQARLLRAWRRLGRRPGVRWAKKVAAFPIGERFAVISLSAALFDARVTFVVMLAWGGASLIYVVAGRLLRSLRSRTFGAITQDSVQLEAYRGDGPLAQALGAALGRVVPVRPAVLVAAALLVMAVAVLPTGDDAPAGVAAAAVAAAVLLAGTAAGRPNRDRVRWTVPPMLRLLEFGAVTWLATQAGPQAVPAAFAFLGAVTFRHYDLVYRLRQRGEEAPAWVQAVSLGWDGRLVLALLLTVVAGPALGLWVAAAVLGGVLVAEAVHSWLTFSRTQRAPAYEDEEEETE